VTGVWKKKVLPSPSPPQHEKISTEHQGITFRKRVLFFVVIIISILNFKFTEI